MKVSKKLIIIHISVDPADETRSKERIAAPECVRHCQKSPLRNEREDSRARSSGTERSVEEGTQVGRDAQTAAVR